MWCRRGDILGANKRVEESGEEMEIGRASSRERV